MRTALACAGACLALTAPAAAQVPVPPPAPAPAPPPAQPAPKRIAHGVSAGGVPLGGLTRPEASRLVAARLGARLGSPLVVRVGRARATLRMRTLRLKFGPDRTARRAYRAGLNLGPGAPGGGVTGVDVAPFVSYRRSALRAWVANLGGRLFVAPRNARLRITIRRMVRRKGRNGSALSEWRLRRAIARAVTDPRRARGVAGRRRRVRPAITYAGLARRNRTVVTIDRGGFRLRLFKRLRYDRSYPIAVGAAGFDTPSGLFRITNKRVNPSWTAPNRPWAGSYAGRTVPGGAPDNPLTARWLGVTGSVGIHGTAEAWSIGSRASHGCIRMHVSDVIDLYPRVPYGAAVLIR